MADLPRDLRDALTVLGAGFPVTQLAGSVNRLIERYHEDSPGVEPILRSRLDAVAYATYRMPATYAATRSVLAELARLDPGFAPRTLLDLGGGTGAASWAAASIWPSLRDITVVEQVAEVIHVGRRLASGAAAAAVRAATWRHAGLDGPLPAADLVTVAYVLGELTAQQRVDLYGRLAGHGAVIALIEPGTPAGFERIAAARDQLIAAGLHVHAPCPHDGTCPLPRGQDWCHFATRVNRSTLHRTAKSATLGFEDEKYAYVVASPRERPRAAGRVVRHPLRRSGLVTLRVCAGPDGLRDVTVSRRQGELYRAARDVRWGDPWPPQT